MLRTLILDASHTPVKIVPWQEAFVNWFLDKAIILDTYPEKARSANDSFDIPLIIQLKSLSKSPNKFKVPLSRENLFKRDNYRCAYCGEHFKRTDLSIDHIIPLCQGGHPWNWKNLITSCKSCNSKKGGRTPEQSNMPLLFKASEPRYNVMYILNIREKEKLLFKDYLFRQ